MVHTMYKQAKCGKRLAGYGKADLDANLENHENWCGICRGLKQETLKANVAPETTLKEEVKVEEKKPVPMDLDGDGDFDKDDLSIAGKVMAAGKKLVKGKSSRKKKK